MASLAISIMNRNGRVLRCINSWLAWEGCEEVVIIDWSSEFLISDFLKKQGFYDKKIKIVRVDGEQYFSRSRSFNLSVKHCTCEEVVRIDVDYVLTDEGLLNEVYQKAHNKRQEYSNKIEVISEQVADNNEILKTEVAWLDSTYKDLQKRITDFNNTTWQSKAQAEAAQEKINEDLKAFTKRHEEYLDLSNDQQARIHLAKKIYE